MTSYFPAILVPAGKAEGGNGEEEGLVVIRASVVAPRERPHDGSTSDDSGDGWPAANSARSTRAAPATSGWEPPLDRFRYWIAAAVVLILIAYVPFLVMELPPRLLSRGYQSF
jgi:hypothetical protein